MQVQLKFIYFQLQFQRDCNYDYLEVRKGLTDSYPLIGKYCGERRPPVIHSNSGSLHITFVSDSSDSYKGFHAEFKAIPQVSGKHAYERMLHLDEDNLF